MQPRWEAEPCFPADINLTVLRSFGVYTQFGIDPNRIEIPFTNEHFIAFCEKMLGQPYWYGTCLYKCTSGTLSRKAAQYPSSYASSRMTRYKQDVAAKKVCADCIGACKGYAWTGGGVGVLESIGTDQTYASKYGSNGCPDKGANGMFTYAKSKGMDWGAIETLPEIVGLALYKSGHVGYYAGNGYAIEWKGFAYGCVKTKVAGRGWTHWYKLPFIHYSDSDITIPVLPAEETIYALGDRLLKKGCKGADVTALQGKLIELGYDLPKFGADGNFGAETEAAVIAFQKAKGLNADGIAGSLTLAELTKPSAPIPAQKYILQLGTFDTKAEAELSLAKLQSAGFAAIITEFNE